MEKKKWKGKTGGTPLMLRMLTAMLRFMPLWMVYFGMGLVVPFYMIFAPGFKVMHRYFRLRHGHGWVRAVWSVYLNYFTFGMVIVDRFAHYAGKRFCVTVEDNREFDKLCARPEGFMMLSSHTGNYEMCGYTLRGNPKRLSNLFHPGEQEEVMKNRAAAWADAGISMVLFKDDMSHLFLLDQALSEGQIVSIEADRVLGSPKTVKCRFMGGEADFPQGPFAMACVRGVEVICCQVMKTGIKKYTVTLTKLDVPCDMNKRQRIPALAQAYADQLERSVRQHPYQWFNYYEFWNDDTPRA